MTAFSERGRIPLIQIESISAETETAVVLIRNRPIFLMDPGALPGMSWKERTLFLRCKGDRWIIDHVGPLRTVN